MSQPHETNETACPKCGSVSSRVMDSRGRPSGDSRRRRRICAKCEHRFTTYEISQKTFDDFCAAINGLRAFKLVLEKLPQAPVIEGEEEL